jgi:hypothetical protein
MDFLGSDKLHVPSSYHCTLRRNFMYVRNLFIFGKQIVCLLSQTGNAGEQAGIEKVQVTIMLLKFTDDT